MSSYNDYLKNMFYALRSQTNVEKQNSQDVKNNTPINNATNVFANQSSANNASKRVEDFWNEEWGNSLFDVWDDALSLQDQTTWEQELVFDINTLLPSTVHTSGGSDHIYVDSHKNGQLYSEEGADKLEAYNSHNIFFSGGAGNDLIFAGNNTDIGMDSGEDDDILVSYHNTNSNIYSDIRGGNGDDLLISVGDTNVSSDGGYGNDFLVGLDGTQLKLMGRGDGNSGGNIGDGNDTFKLFNSVDSHIIGGYGNDIVEVFNSHGSDTNNYELFKIDTGKAGDDTGKLYNISNGSMRTQRGNDVFTIGHAENFKIYTEDDDDIFTFTDIESNNLMLNMGDGKDTVNLAIYFDTEGKPLAGIDYKEVKNTDGTLDVTIKTSDGKTVTISEVEKIIKTDPLIQDPGFISLYGLVKEIQIASGIVVSKTPLMANFETAIQGFAVSAIDAKNGAINAASYEEAQLFADKAKSEAQKATTEFEKAQKEQKIAEEQARLAKEKTELAREKEKEVLPANKERASQLVKTAEEANIKAQDNLQQINAKIALMSESVNTANKAAEEAQLEADKKKDAARLAYENVKNAADAAEKAAQRADGNENNAQTFKKTAEDLIPQVINAATYDEAQALADKARVEANKTSEEATKAAKEKEEAIKKAEEAKVEAEKTKGSPYYADAQKEVVRAEKAVQLADSETIKAKEASDAAKIAADTAEVEAAKKKDAAYAALVKAQQAARDAEAAAQRADANEDVGQGAYQKSQEMLPQVTNATTYEEALGFVDKIKEFAKQADEEATKAAKEKEEAIKKAEEAKVEAEKTKGSPYYADAQKEVEKANKAVTLAGSELEKAIEAAKNAQEVVKTAEAEAEKKKDAARLAYENAKNAANAAEAAAQRADNKENDVQASKKAAEDLIPQVINAATYDEAQALADKARVEANKALENSQQAEKEKEEAIKKAEEAKIEAEKTKGSPYYADSQKEVERAGKAIQLADTEAIKAKEAADAAKIAADTAEVEAAKKKDAAYAALVKAQQAARDAEAAAQRADTKEDSTQNSKKDAENALQRVKDAESYEDALPIVEEAKKAAVLAREEATKAEAEKAEALKKAEETKLEAEKTKGSPYYADAQKEIEKATKAVELGNTEAAKAIEAAKAAEEAAKAAEAEALRKKLDASRLHLEKAQQAAQNAEEAAKVVEAQDLATGQRLTTVQGHESAARDAKEGAINAATYDESQKFADTAKELSVKSEEELKKALQEKEKAEKAAKETEAFIKIAQDEAAKVDPKDEEEAKKAVQRAEAAGVKAQQHLESTLSHVKDIDVSVATTKKLAEEAQLAADQKKDAEAKSHLDRARLAADEAEKIAKMADKDEDKINESRVKAEDLVKQVIAAKTYDEAKPLADQARTEAEGAAEKYMDIVQEKAEALKKAEEAKMEAEKTKGTKYYEEAQKEVTRADNAVKLADQELISAKEGVERTKIAADQAELEAAKKKDAASVALVKAQQAAREAEEAAKSVDKTEDSIKTVDQSLTNLISQIETSDYKTAANLIKIAEEQANQVKTQAQEAQTKKQLSLTKAQEARDEAAKTVGSPYEEDGKKAINQANEAEKLATGEMGNISTEIKSVFDKLGQVKKAAAQRALEAAKEDAVKIKTTAEKADSTVKSESSPAATKATEAADRAEKSTQHSEIVAMIDLAKAELVKAEAAEKKIKDDIAQVKLQETLNNIEEAASYTKGTEYEQEATSIVNTASSGVDASTASSAEATKLTEVARAAVARAEAALVKNDAGYAALLKARSAVQEAEAAAQSVDKTEDSFKTIDASFSNLLKQVENGDYKTAANLVKVADEQAKHVQNEAREAQKKKQLAHTKAQEARDEAAKTTGTVHENDGKKVMTQADDVDKLATGEMTAISGEIRSIFDKLKQIKDIAGRKALEAAKDGAGKIKVTAQGLDSIVDTESTPAAKKATTAADEAEKAEKAGNRQAILQQIDIAKAELEKAKRAERDVNEDLSKAKLQNVLAQVQEAAKATERTQHEKEAITIVDGAVKDVDASSASSIEAKKNTEAAQIAVARALAALDKLDGNNYQAILDQVKVKVTAMKKITDETPPHVENNKYAGVAIYDFTVTTIGNPGIQGIDIGKYLDTINKENKITQDNNKQVGTLYQEVLQLLKSIPEESSFYSVHENELSNLLTSGADVNNKIQELALTSADYTKIGDWGGGVLYRTKLADGHNGKNTLDTSKDLNNIIFNKGATIQSYLNKATESYNNLDNASTKEQADLAWKELLRSKHLALDVNTSINSTLTVVDETYYKNIGKDTLSAIDTGLSLLTNRSINTFKPLLTNSRDWVTDFYLKGLHKTIAGNLTSQDPVQRERSLNNTRQALQGIEDIEERAYQRYIQIFGVEPPQK